MAEQPRRRFSDREKVSGALRILETVCGTEEELAKGSGLSQPRISQLRRKGIHSKQDSFLASIQKIIRHLGEEAAQHKSGDGIDRVREAALLDRRKREEIEIRIAEKVGKLISDEIVIDGISAAFGAAKAGLLGIPSKYKSKCPHISLEDLEILRDIIIDVCAEYSNDRFPAGIRKGLEKGRGRNGAAAATDSKPVGGRKKKT